MTVHIVDSRIFGHLWRDEEADTLFSDEARTARWLDILVALADAQAALDLIPLRAARRLRAHLDSAAIDVEQIAARTRATGHSTLGLISWLREILPEDLGQWVYYGATVQDLTDTWTALVLRTVTDLLDDRLRRLSDRAAELAAQHRETLQCGRTHGQPGLPITFGFKAAVWTAELDRHRTRLADGRPRWEVVQLGGALGTAEFWDGKGVALLEALAERLGLRAPAIPWLTSRDGIAEFTCLLAVVTGTLAKIGNEIMELQRPEIGELREPFLPGQVGSITMPHKRNPEMCEHLDTLARLARGDAMVALEGLVQLHERDGRGWKAEWAFLPSVCNTALRAAGMALGVLDGLEVDSSRMEANLNATQGYVLSEPVMRALAKSVGKHTAQEIVYTAALEGRRRQQPFRDALLADPLVLRWLGVTGVDAALCLDDALGDAGLFVDRVLAARRAEPTS